MQCIARALSLDFATLFYVLATFITGVDGQQDMCQCGFEAACDTISENCTCSDGFLLHSNGKDCKNDTCLASDCLSCSQENLCIRCLHFILSTDRRCVDRCNGEAYISSNGPLQGNVCEQDNSNSKLIIAIVAGVGAGLLLCILAVVFVCIYIRKTRKKVTLQSQEYNSAQIEMGNIKQFPAYENQGFENEFGGEIKTGVIDPVEYTHRLEQLRPHTEMLMTLLSQIRPKLRAMDPADPRIPTYKGVIHQLCRVLVLLHRKETGSSIPSDALGLIEWAHQMLDDHRQQQELNHEAVNPDVIGNLGHNRISYIDVDTKTEGMHAPAVYADPVGSGTQSLRSGSSTTPYSSVPVPLPSGNSTFPRKGAFAAIRRTPSVPGTLSKAGYACPTDHHQMSATSKPKNKSIGYFANGRYYDPNPMPQLEVYAPASSYSDRSTGHLSTFAPDRPRSRSLSSTEPSSDGDGMADGEEGSDGDMDIFPFDPRDATEPVEV